MLASQAAGLLGIYRPDVSCKRLLRAFISLRQYLDTARLTLQLSRYSTTPRCLRHYGRHQSRRVTKEKITPAFHFLRPAAGAPPCSAARQLSAATRRAHGDIFRGMPHRAADDFAALQPRGEDTRGKYFTAWPGRAILAFVPPTLASIRANRTARTTTALRAIIATCFGFIALTRARRV